MQWVRVDQQLHTFHAEVLALRSSPVIIDFMEQGTDQTEHRQLVWENTNHLGSAFDLPVEPL